MSVNAAPGIDGFTRLTDSISIHRPQTTLAQQTASAKQPSLIVVCSWMNAAEKHIAKYTAGYQRLYPHATILLAQCSLKGFFTSKVKQEILLKPAYETILDHISNGGKKGPVILHAFSNGGGTIANHISAFLNERSPDQKLIFEKVILDCLPGLPSLEGAVKAVSFSLPRNPVLRLFGQWIFRIWLLTYGMLVYSLRGREDKVNRLRRRLNDPQRFHLGAPRLYLYSKADELVQHQAVADHAEDARRKGYHVTEQVSINAAHCGIVRNEPERYWGAVQAHINGAPMK